MADDIRSKHTEVSVSPVWEDRGEERFNPNQNGGVGR